MTMTAGWVRTLSVSAALSVGLAIGTGCRSSAPRVPVQPGPVRPVELPAAPHQQAVGQPGRWGAPAVAVPADGPLVQVVAAFPVRDHADAGPEVVDRAERTVQGHLAGTGGVRLVATGELERRLADRAGFPAGGRVPFSRDDMLAVGRESGARIVVSVAVTHWEVTEQASRASRFPISLPGVGDLSTWRAKVRVAVGLEATALDVLTGQTVAVARGLGTALERAGRTDAEGEPTADGSVAIGQAMNEVMAGLSAGMRGVEWRGVVLGRQRDGDGVVLSVGARAGVTKGTVLRVVPAPQGVAGGAAAEGAAVLLRVVAVEEIWSVAQVVPAPGRAEMQAPQLPPAGSLVAPHVGPVPEVAEPAAPGPAAPVRVGPAAAPPAAGPIPVPDPPPPAAVPPAPATPVPAPPEPLKGDPLPPG